MDDADNTDARDDGRPRESEERRAGRRAGRREERRRHGRRLYDTQRIENAPITPKLLMAYGGAAVGLASTLVTGVMWASSLAGRVDLLTQHQNAYEQANDTQRTMLLKDRDDWRAAMAARMTESERRQAADEQASAQLQTELKSQLSGLSMQVQGIAESIRRMDRAGGGPGPADR